MNYKICTNDKCGVKHWQTGILCDACYEAAVRFLHPIDDPNGMNIGTGQLGTHVRSERYYPARRLCEVKRAACRKKAFAKELEGFKGRAG